MINEENIQKLYESIIEDSNLTTHRLNTIFTNNDIKKLIEKKIITRIKRGHYSIIAIDDLFQYGQNLINQKKYLRAKECFERCYQLDPHNLTICFQLFLRNIDEKNYEQALHYLNKLLTTNNPYYYKDAIFYLYLLNIITDIPDNLQKYLKYLKYEDLKIDSNDKRYTNINLQNQVRLYVYNKKFKPALTLINKDNTSKLQNLVVKILLSQAIYVNKKSKAKLLTLAQNKEYQEIITLINKKDSKNNLSLIESYILKLAIALANIQKTNQIPPIKSNKSNSIYNAIDTNNYELAMILNKEYLQKYNNNITNQTISILLKDMCNIIKQIKLKEETAPINIIINYLTKEDINNALRLLRKYLNNINKKEYEFLIVDLIKLSLIKKDFTFTKIKNTLSEIKEEKYHFILSEYIENFYISLSQRQYKEARIYLNSISKADKIGQECILNKELQQILNISVGIITKKKIMESQQKIEMSPNENFIKKQYELLANGKNIIILNPMTNEKRKEIYHIVKQYQDMVAFSIGKGNEKAIVLRYKPYISEDINITKLIEKGHQAYHKKDYDKSINIFTKLLYYGTPTPSIYTMLGLSYLKKKDKKTAIDYLIIANELNKGQNSKYNYEELITKLKKDLNKEKEKFNFKVEDFTNTQTKNFTIPNLDEITDYLLTSGLTFEQVLQNLELTDEQIDNLKLIYAQILYSHKYYDKGDEFIKAVEQSHNKTKQTNRLLEETKKNKRFYSNKPSTKDYKLLLSLKPQKRTNQMTK